MGHGDAPTKKKRRASRRDLKGPGVIELPHRSSAQEGTTRIGLLSWSQRYTGDGSAWVEDDLIYSLGRMRKQREIDADLILCSGVSFYSEAKESDHATARRITTASGGCPVLMEWPDDDDRNEWWLARDDNWERVRCDQYVKTASKVGSGGRLVLEEIGADFGMLRVENGPTMVLLICNEARILGRDATDSVISRIVTRPSTGVPGVFSNEWVLLHPSHRPHRRRSHYNGWDLLGKTRMNGDALFQCVTVPSPVSADGSKHPTSVFHAGPWQPGVDWQESASVCKFVNGKRRKSQQPVTVDGLVEIRYAEFET